MESNQSHIKSPAQQSARAGGAEEPSEVTVKLEFQ